MKPKLSILMPMYDEKHIHNNIKSVMSVFDKQDFSYEIIVIDDGSKNKCFSEAKKIKSSKVKVVGYKKNQGKGNALKYGFKFAKGDLIAFLDSDLELSPRDIISFMKLMKEQNTDIVIGSKRHPESRVRYPLARRFMSSVYQHFIHLLFDLNVRETQVGLKLFKAEVLRKVFPKMLVKRFAFDLELLVIANKLGYKIIEAPIELKYKFGSTINIKSVFYILLDTAAIFYRLKVIHYYDKN